MAMETETLTEPAPLNSHLAQRTKGPVRRFRMIALAAISAAAVPYLWVLWDLWNGTLDPLRTDGPINLSTPAYDVQARAMLHGHLSLPNGIGLESFIHDGRIYTYFGIFPSLLRLPVFLFTSSLDGRLTAISLFGAWLVTATFSTLLLWRIRIVIRGDAPLGWAEAISYGALLFSILSGSVLVFLASEPNVFSEDLAWGVALACGSVFALLGVIERPSWGRIAASGVLILLTNLNRATSGYACVLGALLIAAWFAFGRAGTDNRRWSLPMMLVGLVPLAVGCVIDWAKFGIFFGFPASEQLLYKAYGLSGGYFSLRFLPDTLMAYVDPTHLRLSRIFPYITFPAYLTQTPDSAIFNEGPTASVLPSVPLLFGAGVWGVITTFAPGRPIYIRRAADPAHRHRGNRRINIDLRLDLRTVCRRLHAAPRAGEHDRLG